MDVPVDKPEVNNKTDGAKRGSVDSEFWATDLGEDYSKKLEEVKQIIQMYQSSFEDLDSKPSEDLCGYAVELFLGNEASFRRLCQKTKKKEKETDLRHTLCCMFRFDVGLTLKRSRVFLHLFLLFCFAAAVDGCWILLERVPLEIFLKRRLLVDIWTCP